MHQAAALHLPGGRHRCPDRVAGTELDILAGGKLNDLPILLEVTMSKREPNRHRRFLLCVPTVNT